MRLSETDRFEFADTGNAYKALDELVAELAAARVRERQLREALVGRDPASLAEELREYASEIENYRDESDDDRKRVYLDAADVLAALDATGGQE